MMALEGFMSAHWEHLKNRSAIQTKYPEISHFNAAVFAYPNFHTNLAFLPLKIKYGLKPHESQDANSNFY
jgi:hypothetical protein